MSRAWIAIVLTALAVLAAAGLGMPHAGAQPAAEALRFAAIDVYVDSPEPLAAWQFELREGTGAMAVVGVENGDSDAYANAPHYDLDVTTRARAERLIVADYSLADASALPRGRMRVATVHISLAGEASPAFELQLIAAGNPAGEPIPAQAVFELQEGSPE